MGYIFGLTILNLIDNKLDKKIDQINSENFKNQENFKEIITTKTYNFNDGEEIKIKKYDKKTKELQNSFDMEGYSNYTNPFKEWEIENKKTQTCIKNHEHNKNGDYCNYGVTNYADPHDMSEIDYKIFMLNYPPNMTLQDYVNWLYCFSGKENELPYNHLKNLEKLKSNIELVEQEGVLPPPSYYFPPKDAKDYFDKMYNDSNEFNIAGPLNSITGPMIGYNYNDYSEFSQNLDMNGSSGLIRNDDIKNKKNAKVLHNYINPKDSRNLEIDKKYEIYRIKNVEI